MKIKDNQGLDSIVINKTKKPLTEDTLERFK